MFICQSEGVYPGRQRYTVVKRLGILFLLTIVFGGGLGACSTAMETTSSLGDRDILSLNNDITPEKERSQIFKLLGRMKMNHHRNAIKEIEAR